MAKNEHSLSAKWMIAGYDCMKTKPEIVANGFNCLVLSKYVWMVFPGHKV